MRGRIAAGIESVIEDAKNGAHGMSSQAATYALEDGRRF
jgi:hypothetical protein